MSTISLLDLPEEILQNIVELYFLDTTIELRWCLPRIRIVPPVTPPMMVCSLLSRLIRHIFYENVRLDISMISFKGIVSLLTWLPKNAEARGISKGFVLPGESEPRLFHPVQLFPRLSIDSVVAEHLNEEPWFFNKVLKQYLPMLKNVRVREEILVKETDLKSSDLTDDRGERVNESRYHVIRIKKCYELMRKFAARGVVSEAYVRFGRRIEIEHEYLHEEDIRVIVSAENHVHPYLIRLQDPHLYECLKDLLAFCFSHHLPPWEGKIDWRDNTIAIASDPWER